MRLQKIIIILIFAVTIAVIAFSVYKYTVRTSDCRRLGYDGYTTIEDVPLCYVFNERTQYFEYKRYLGE